MRYCQYTYAALLVHLCCTFGARVLHFYWHYYSKVFTVAFLSAKLDKSRGHLTIIHTRICFSNTNRTNLTNLVGCDMVYIRGIREICGQLNIIHTRICFSNTNRTNLTNLVGCDPVYIRGIREICGQLNTPVILHSICCNALCQPAATELKSKNTHGVSRIFYGVFSRICFLIFV